ncbi:uncharacterized protein F5147DRAFT_647200 [Suillus discolor]|uniref:Uncharacterized protein n=1 Tax=Suillus discolor TaxID=1912936 RepID=A0A9P7FJV7_9AGAM|nr:uncharacterized protein F5147DRAFT_647200 [Suillus discolor]KAG2120773.1 hypothetical protein F5147DRAFT_647200 [Suillus discolor]
MTEANALSRYIIIYQSVPLRLRILKDATTFFSCSTPNLATVIPAMDLIHETLTSYSRNQKYCASIHAAVHLAKETLNRYYELTDKSEKIVLHPQHKLSYFKNAGWTEEWINTAETLVHEEFECSYSILDIKNDTDTEMDEEPAGLMDVDSSMYVYYSTLIKDSRSVMLSNVVYGPYYKTLRNREVPVKLCSPQVMFSSGTRRQVAWETMELTSFFVHEASDSMLKCEIIGWGTIKGNNEIFIGWGKTKSENENKIFIRNIDINFL